MPEALSPRRRAVRPRDAATLILVRQDGPRRQVLMGRRNASHSFMPGGWVFPGGRVDRADFRAPTASDLRPEVEAVLHGYLKPGRARAVALAAIRETFEEAGLLLAAPAPPRPAVGPWRDFLAQGVAPDLAALEVLGRAITPPHLSRRFDTWFLMAAADRLVSLDRQPDCGELEEIAWHDFEAALELPLAEITRTMIGEAVARLDNPARQRPFLRRGVFGAQGEL